MKLKELFTMIEYNNKFNKMMDTNIIQVVVLDAYFARDKHYVNLDKFIKDFNEVNYSCIDEDTELINKDGYIQFTVTDFDRIWENGTLKDVPKDITYNIHLDTIQIF